MIVIHVIPENSAFTKFVKHSADDANQPTIKYSVVPYIGVIKPIYIFKIIRLYFKDPETLFIFHQVPAITLFFLSFLIPNYRYLVLFWGGDFYENFYPEYQIENRHNIKLKNKNKLFSLGDMVFYCRRYMAFKMLERSAGIASISDKQFRIIRKLYIKSFKKTLSIPRLKIVHYNNSSNIHLFKPRHDSESMTILICHSATKTLNHSRAISILKDYRSIWDAKIYIKGFLSYGGKSKASIDELEKQLINEWGEFETIEFERSFLNEKDLLDKLSQIDLALFCCQRDEGVTMLRSISRCGGVLVMDEKSMNYDLFKREVPNKIISIKNFLRSSPNQLSQKRNVPPSLMMENRLKYEDLSMLNYNKGKICLPENMRLK